MKFKVNPFARAELVITEEMRLTLARTAGRVADVARYLAPVDEGEYARRIFVASGLEGVTMIARVNAYDFKSNWIEFGTGNPGPTNAYAPLRRACDETGVKLHGGGRAA